MIQTRSTPEKEHHRKTILAALKQTQMKAHTAFLYLEARSRLILNALMPESELFNAGFSKIMNKECIPQQDIDQIVIVAVLNSQAMEELERYWHLFGDVTILHLNISGSHTKELLRVSPLRKKLRAFTEISLNFIPFIDSVYSSAPHPSPSKDHQPTSFEQSLSSFLISLPKFHEFQFSLVDNSTSKNLAEKIKSKLEQKLSVLESHKYQQYTAASSPRIKVLVLERKIDQMSPLLYSYYYGAISQQIEAFQHVNNKFTTNSTLYKTLFPMDIEQAGQFLTNLAQEKAENQKQKFQLHQFQKAKKIITKHYDQNTSPQEIQLHIDALKSVREFCKRRNYTTALQQTVVNARSETDFKMTPGKVVDFVVKWANMPLTQYKPSQDDFVKIVILSYMVNSFWFWQRRVLNAGLEKKNKDKILNFCKKVEGKFKPLEEKPQGQERYDLFRHQPLIVKEVKYWAHKDKAETYLNFEINKTAINRQSKRILAIKGPLGYGQLAMLIKELKQDKKTSDILIFCEYLVTTKEYLKIILGQKQK